MNSNRKSRISHCIEWGLLVKSIDEKVENKNHVSMALYFKQFFVQRMCNVYHPSS
jgi:hypothetical protein